jgi:hypothetical protein
LRAIRQIVFGKCVVGNKSDAVAQAKIVNRFTQRVDFAPAFMTTFAGLKRIRKPGPTLPQSQIRAADTTACDSNTNLR